MQALMLRALGIGLALFSTLLAAAPTPPGVRAELDGLFAELQRQQCKLYRNGSWHEAAQARQHMLRKLAYLEERGTVQSAEQFIEQAATKSSTSGKPYEVQCGQAPAQPSRTWLLAALAAQRKARAASAP
ncbi:ATP phosphoribosyltransferase regulatory subunit HisZ [Inhella inkyongensis]|uniref:ATP phosphoribosyltransferase regulatory subunit HisZ n=1 Tax=Inhella inkyongensis TaxID=392593 RepID=A0A840S233_9BURK|nr:DUF5329 family protein [Inhella inkyongensis]MBB5203146.1 ATP phosphoribosyltransferase regulatory subunit HisZ [Inhella inkyongensis]